MRCTAYRVYRGPSIYSRCPVIRCTLETTSTFAPELDLRFP
jgi:hypothetical protein